MFSIKTTCPTPANKGKDICKGTRINGMLKNDCAICAAYKKYVKLTVPDMVAQN